MENLQQAITELEAIVKALPNVLEYALVGSALYLGAGDVRDVDYAVLVDDFEHENVLAYAREVLMRPAGWQPCSIYGEEGQPGEDAEWTSVRNGYFNLMLTSDRAWFDRYKAAMQVCKALRLATRVERIVVCRIVRDGCTAEEAAKFVDLTEAETPQ